MWGKRRVDLLAEDKMRSDNEILLVACVKVLPNKPPVGSVIKSAERLDENQSRDEPNTDLKLIELNRNLKLTL